MLLGVRQGNKRASRARHRAPPWAPRSEAWAQLGPLVLTASGQWVPKAPALFVSLPFSGPQAGEDSLPEASLQCQFPAARQATGQEGLEEAVEREPVPDLQQTGSHLDFKTHIPLPFPLNDNAFY